MPRHGPGSATWLVRPLILLAVLLLLPSLSACGDDERPGPPPQELPGIWVATESEFVSRSPPARTVEIVSLGGSVLLFLRPDGTFALDLTAPGAPAPWRREGIWIDDWDVLRLEYTVGGGGVNEFDMRYRDNVLSLRGADSFYDFGTGGEDARWNLLMVKQPSQ
ncbi:MAG: hypothetical protein EA422_12565 [Gemmatimonadales bacterium]|nr:MAG: hypothetical protein EA422_12565 [Gemmatimonadales bacterium]